MSIRRDISTILEFTIPKGEYRREFRQLQIEGRITTKHIVEILVLLIEREEEREGNG